MKPLWTLMTTMKSLMKTANSEFDSPVFNSDMHANSLSLTQVDG